MGNLGIPFDFCMTEDAERVIGSYKVAVFTAPVSSESGENAKKLCDANNLPYIETSPEKPYFTKEELIDFFASEGIHRYNSDGHVVYCEKGFLGIHSAKDGEATISLPGKYRIRPLLDTDFTECEAYGFSIYMKQFDTAVFELI
jgi:hypothetical protein